MGNSTDADWERERQLDRDFEREPTFGRRAPRRLVETGTVKQQFATPAVRK